MSNTSSGGGGSNIVGSSVAGGGVECSWGETESDIKVFVKEVVMDQVNSIRKCLSGEETEERKRTQDDDYDDNDKNGDAAMEEQASRNPPGASLSPHPITNAATASRPTVASVTERLALLRRQASERPPSPRETPSSPFQQQQQQQHQWTHSESAPKSVSYINSVAAATIQNNNTSTATAAVAAEETIDPWPHEDDEDDDDDGEEEEDEELSWRMSPLKSMSDWTIHVAIVPQSSHRHQNNVDVYHVHKSVLAVGPRRSNYFVNLFREHYQIQQQQKSQQQPWPLPDIPSKTTILGLPASAAHPHPPTANNNKNNDGGSTTTRLELPALAASAFPCLLDFLYDTQGTKEGLKSNNNNRKDHKKHPNRFLTSHNATALHVLAQRLDMKALRIRARDYWMADICLDNLAIYYQHATCLDDPLILRALEMHTAQHLFDDNNNINHKNTLNATIADIFDLLDPQFILNVITLASNEVDNSPIHTDRQAFSLRLSLLIAVYCHQHQQSGDLDPVMFERLTDARHLPTLEAPAAKALLEMHDALNHASSSSSSLTGTHRGSSNERTISSLTERCIAVLSDQWDDACIMTEEEQSGGRGPERTVNLPRLAGPALEAFVSLSLVNAKNRLVRLEAEKTEAQNRHHDCQTINDTLQQENDALQRKIWELQHQERASIDSKCLVPSRVLETKSNGTLVHSSPSRTGFSLPKTPPTASVSFSSSAESDSSPLMDQPQGRLDGLEPRSLYEDTGSRSYAPRHHQTSLDVKSVRWKVG